MNTRNLSALLKATVELNGQSWISYNEGLDPEQLDCLADPARHDECLEMLDDMEARLGFDVMNARAAVLAIWAEDHADELREEAP